MSKKIEGFSKFTKSEKIDWITKTHFKNAKQAKKQLESYWSLDSKLQARHEEFIENTLSNFYLPLGVAPNFLINGDIYTLPMVIEESSVVAAAANAAKFWSKRGGFKTKVINSLKVGQIHFFYEGNPKELSAFFKNRKSDLLKTLVPLTKNMEARGGGVMSLDLIDKCDILENYYQLHLRFKTGDAMGANFINSCLEHLAKSLIQFASKDQLSNENNKPIDVLMSILSNYVPECLVHAEVSCPIKEFNLDNHNLNLETFTKRMIQAVAIAKYDPYRAVTHNKGIMNGVDALIIATGNDFRAIEAGVHAYAARSGQYRSLSDAYIKDDKFVMELSIPLALGTVGGLTKLHPMVNWCMELLGNPSSEKLMEIIAVAGLAQNFSALRSLITTGIQKGHMKMHLLNILNQLNANDTQKIAAINYFKTEQVSIQAVHNFLKKNKL
ncbi:MAG: hydroxymethylglutaryl-CoA reductase, degradative [Flavobacteriaceae bacterium]